MPLDVLRSELERLFELDQLKELSRTVLGSEAEQLQGATARGSLAGALVERCREVDAVAALCDALVASREGVSQRLHEVRARGFCPVDATQVGHSLGSYMLERKLGEGALSAVYLAHREAKRFRLKLLRPEITLDRARVQRFFAASRAVGMADHPGLPRGVVAQELDGRMVVLHEYQEGRPLGARLEVHQPKKLRHVWLHLRQLLEALSALHARHIVHGNLRPDNVLVVPVDEGSDEVLLLDAGAHFLRSPRPTPTPDERSVGFVGPRYAAPEQIRGDPSTASSDVYSFGALLYEMLSGHAPFGEDDVKAMVGHLTRDPEPLSFVTPRGWVDSELDEFVLAMLDKDPMQRPPDADAVLDVLEVLAGQSARRDSSFPEAEFNDRVRLLMEDPASEEAAGVLEAGIDQGADARAVAEAFRLAAEDLTVGPEARVARKRLLTRSGALYENVVRDPDAATQSYRLLLELDAADAAALAALERIYRRQGKHEKLVDLLVEQAQRGEGALQRARAYAKLGHLFATRLSDPEEALVAFTHAFAQDPSDGAVIGEIERLGGAQSQTWNEILAGCADALSGDLPVENTIAVLNRMGHWYSEKLTRPDMAVRCFERTLSADPANDTALAELSIIYRRAQQWKDLSRTLARRSNAAVTPAQGRELRAEAAQVLDERLRDTEAAAQLYEQILEEDPAHEKAGEALTRMYERAEDWDAVIRILKLRAEALIGEQRHRLLCRVADHYERRLEDRANARLALAIVIQEAPDHLDALRAMEQLVIKTGDPNGLLENLEQQLRFAVTPQQKLQLLRRIAGLHEEEFRDRAEAARAYERMLEVEPAAIELLERLAEHYTSLEYLGELADVLERHAEALEPGPEKSAKLLELSRLYANRIADTERALKACESALAVDPKNRDALDLLAELRTSTGDDERAVEAIDALAEEASPESRSLHLLRAALLLQKRGDLDGVIEHCKTALEATPDDHEAAFTLSEAYLERGDADLAIEVLERSIARTKSAWTEARLCVQLAHLLRDHLHDLGRAEAAAARAAERDPSNPAGRILLADLTYAVGKYDEAAACYAQVASQLVQSDPTESPRHARQFMESLARTGATDTALEVAAQFGEDAPQDSKLQAEISEFVLVHGSPERARELAEQYLEHFDSRLDQKQRAAALFRLGDAARRQGDHEAAVGPLEQSAELDQESVDALDALGAIHEQHERWTEVQRTLERRLERVGAEQHVELLIRLGELAEAKLHQPEVAGRHYLAALGERPGERRILLRLLHLYSGEKDWTHLMEVVTELAESATEPDQRARYLHTAARVAAHELEDRAGALKLLDQAQAAGPKLDATVQEAVALRKDLEDVDGLRMLLEEQLAVAADAQDRDRGLRYAEQLADLHLSQLRVEDAITVYEAAQQMDPYNGQRQEVLGELYASDPDRYRERAVRAQEQFLAQDPYRPEPYRLLHRIYSALSHQDGVWCVSQALSVLHRASSEEEAFFRRHRRRDGLALWRHISPEDWVNVVLHPQANPLLTTVFALIQPAVMAARTTSLDEFGYDPADALSPTQHQYGLVRALQRAASVLRIEPPLLFFDPEVAGVARPHTNPPALLLGRAGLTRDVAPARAAFVAATHLMSFWPGFAVRYLLSTPVILRAWMLAAIRLIAPRLPIAPELERPTMDAYEALAEHIKGAALDRLAQPIYRLLQDGVPLDVREWMAGIDYTSDRVGLILSDDLRTALDVLEATGDTAGAAGVYERSRELHRFAVSSGYLELRGRMGIAVGAREPSPEEGVMVSVRDGMSGETPPPAPVRSKPKTQPPPPPDRSKRKSQPPSGPAHTRPKSQPPPPPDRSQRKSRPPSSPVSSRPKSEPPPPPVRTKRSPQ